MWHKMQLQTQALPPFLAASSHLRRCIESQGTPPHPHPRSVRRKAAHRRPKAGGCRGRAEGS